jgi:hypothetical protein
MSRYEMIRDKVIEALKLYKDKNNIHYQNYVEDDELIAWLYEELMKK